MTLLFWELRFPQDAMEVWDTPAVLVSPTMGGAMTLPSICQDTAFSTQIEDLPS